MSNDQTNIYAESIVVQNNGSRRFVHVSATNTREDFMHADAVNSKACLHVLTVVLI